MSHDLYRLADDRAVRGDPDRAGDPHRRVHGGGVHRRADFLSTVSSARSACSTGDQGRPHERAGLEGLCEKPDRSSRSPAGSLLYFILRTQAAVGLHGLNPMGFHSAPWNVTFNTISSFMTNTNWQYYSGEPTMSYFSQMAGLTVQNWLSAGVGIIVAVALIRGIVSAAARASALLAGPDPHDPLRARAAGDRLRRDPRVPGLDRRTSRPISPSTRSPAWSRRSRWARSPPRRRSSCSGQTAAASSTPTRRTRSRPDGLHQLPGDALRPDHPGRAGVHVRPDDRHPPPGLRHLHDDDGDVPRRGDRRLRRRGPRLPGPHAAGLHTGVVAGSTGGNMEGKEQRFGIAGLGAVRRGHHGHLVPAPSTARSSPSPGSAARSPFANLSASEVIFGGVGTGLYSILLYVLAVFIGGLMVGRTPEWLGKKLEAREIKLAGLGILITPLLAALFATALATASKGLRVDLQLAPLGEARTSHTGGLFGDVLRLPLSGQQQWYRRLPDTRALFSRMQATSAPME